MPDDIKDIHFQVPTVLWLQFYRLFPSRGERTSILTSFIKEAIRLQSLKSYYIEEITKGVMAKEVFGE